MIKFLILLLAFCLASCQVTKKRKMIYDKDIPVGAFIDMGEFSDNCVATVNFVPNRHGVVTMSCAW